MSHLIYVATHNAHKLREIGEILSGWEVKGDDPQGVEETAEDFEGNALIKVRAIAARHRGEWCMADDSGLEVAALNGAPGVRSARYAGEPADSARNNELLLANLKGETHRAAQFTCCCALVSPTGKEQTVKGHCLGRIAEAPSGAAGFGYDPLFIPEGYAKSFAELSADEKNAISHRGRALAGVKKLLVALAVILMNFALFANSLWYRQPAPNTLLGWERESLPLGNGHFGVSLFGDPAKEWLQITHNAVLTARDEHKEPGNLTNALNLRLYSDAEGATDYSRGLDLETGVAFVKYTSKNGVRFTRELFVSYPARVLAVRLTANKSESISFKVRPEIPYARSRRGSVVARTADTLLIGEVFDPYRVQFAAHVEVETQGGRVRKGTDFVEVENANSATIYFSCDTNYRLSPEVFSAPNDQKLDANDRPAARVAEWVQAARRKGWDALKAEHLRDFQGLMGRARIRLGGDEQDAQTPTDVLLKRYAAGKRSAYLEETYWQYGRYLLVSSSRPGSLPANLQGVWTAHDVSPWGSGYWHNINVQMNYWPAFQTNLAECFIPYAEFNAAFRPVTRQFALDYLKAHDLGPIPEDGEAPNLWCIGTAVYPYLLCGGPGGHSGPGTGGLTTKLFADWYDFTLDKENLERYGWPVIQGMADFLTRCVMETNGVYLSKFSASPEQMAGKAENGWWGVPHTEPAPYYTTVGCAFDQMMIWENNHDLLKYAKILGREDDPVVKLVEKQILKYDPVQIGASGQIKEFREEHEYGEIGQLDHRHISQLVGLMPGTLITPETPEWMAAAQKTLDLRGDRSTGWALAHRLNARARARQGENAYKLITILLSTKTYPNLWDVHPPFQIDGNFGATAGITEMLLQSQAGFIDLLPALPAAWKTGSFTGLCARGAYEVDCTWQDGRPVSCVVRSKTGSVPVVRFQGERFAYQLR